MVGYFVNWHPRYGMCITGANTKGSPTLEEGSRPGLGKNFVKESTKVVFLANDGRIWTLKENDNGEETEGKAHGTEEA